MTKILIIDDTESNREILGLFIDSLGYTPILAENGEIALGLAKDIAPDLILLDMHMPAVTGDEVLSRLKQSSQLAHIPVIMLSAYNDKQKIIACLELGAEDYLVKPFEPDVLKARIFACLTKKSLTDQILKESQTLNEALQLSREDLLEAQALAKVGSWRWDLQTKQMTFSSEFCRLLGIPQTSDALNDLNFMAYIHREDRFTFSRYLGQVAQERRNAELEYRVLRENGEERIVLMHSKFIATDHKDYIISTMRDITERKQREADTLKLLEENRFLAQRSLAIQDDERRWLARELHDELGQAITAIRFDAEFIETLGNGGTSDSEKLSKIVASARTIYDSAAQMYEVIQELIHQLHPSVLDALGLLQALEDLTQNWQVRHSETVLSMILDGEIEPLEMVIATHLYRIVQESLNNIAKYANASRVNIRLSVNFDRSRLFLSIEDDGCGMTLGEQKRGLGLIGMRERVESMEGKFTIDSAPGQGMKLQAEIPIEKNYQAKRRVWE